jgi:hypothetical protein
MSNHFHLVVETPQPNLVAGMKWLLGTYTSRFNCHRALQNQPLVGGSKPASLRREIHNSFLVCFKEWLAAR